MSEKVVLSNIIADCMDVHYTDNLTEYTHPLVHNQDPSFPGGFNSNIPRGGFGRLAGQSPSAGYEANVTSADNESIPHASISGDTMLILATNVETDNTLH